VTITETRRQTFKTGQVLQEGQTDRACGAVTLFADDDFGHTGIFGILVVVVVAVNEHDDVGILLDGAGLSQVTHHGAFVGALLNTSVQLRQRNHRTLQFFGQHFQAARNLTQLGRAVVAARPARAAHELQIVHHNQAQFATLPRQAAGVGTQL
jgi:hypothetical protein